MDNITAIFAHLEAGAGTEQRFLESFLLFEAESVQNLRVVSKSNLAVIQRQEQALRHSSNAGMFVQHH